MPGMTNGLRDAIHRYTSTEKSDGLHLCDECAAKHACLTRHEEVAKPCDDCERKYVAVWCRWRQLLGQQSSSDTSPPPASLLEEYATAVGLPFAQISPENLRLVQGALPVYVVRHGNRRVAFPSQHHTLIPDRTSSEQRIKALRACKWFMPAYATGAEVSEWYRLCTCTDTERDTLFAELMAKMYTPARIAQIACTYHTLDEFKPHRHAIMDALKAASLGLLHASTITLVAAAEGVLRNLQKTLGMTTIENDSRQLATAVINAAYEKIFSYRMLGTNRLHWIPNEYKGLELNARSDYLYLLLLSFREFLLSEFFSPTKTIDHADDRIVNRHAIIHGITPTRGILLDAVKVTGILEALAHVVGYVTPQGFELYGRLHGAETSDGVVNEPHSSVDAVCHMLTAFQVFKMDPLRVSIESRASQVLDDIVTKGTIVPKRPRRT